MTSAIQYLRTAGQWAVDRGLIKTDKPWRQLFTQLAVFCLVFFGGGALFFSRFGLSFDPQTVRCIPETMLWVVDYEDTVPVRGEAFAFVSKDLHPFFKPGTRMIKYLRGLPGDRVRITGDDSVYINDQYVAYSLKFASSLNKTAADFRGERTLGPDEYWFFGTSVESFDSRYWGGVSREAILGRARSVF